MSELTSMRLRDLRLHAARLGEQDADLERGYGVTTPREGPLSGEWSGLPTPHTLALDLGLTDDELDLMEDLCDRYEDAYRNRFEEE